MFKLAIIIIACYITSIAAQGIKICNVDTPCSDCVQQEHCGFCGSTQQCLRGDDTGPLAGSTCLSTWQYGNNSCANCPSRNSCTDCGLYPECKWCGGDNSRCTTLTDTTACPADPDCKCQELSTCRECTGRTDCSWCETQNQCINTATQPLPPTCGQLVGHSQDHCPSCEGITSCQECGLAGCSWCLGELRVGEPGATTPPQGLCVEPQFCPEPLATCDVVCHTIKTCEECTFTEGCRYCTDKEECQGLDVAHLDGCMVPHECPAVKFDQGTPFDGGSFVGGMFLVIGLAGLGAIVFFAFRFFQRKTSYTEV